MSIDMAAQVQVPTSTVGQKRLLRELKLTCHQNMCLIYSTIYLIIFSKIYLTTYMNFGLLNLIKLNKLQYYEHCRTTTHVLSS